MNVREIIAIIFIVILLGYVVLKKLMFCYRPKKSREIYSYIFAHRGFHIQLAEENTLEAYAGAVENGFAIELDVRFLKKDKTIVCFHDGHTKRLLGRPGKLSNYTLSKLKQYKVVGTEQRVPTLSEALNLIDGKVPVLIEIKDKYQQKGYQETLDQILAKYPGKIYFHTKKLKNYFMLKRKYGNIVFWVMNPFRERFDFVKGRHYSQMVFPAWDDIMFSIEESELGEFVLNKAVELEEDATAKDLIKKLWSLSNRYQSRVQPGHWLLKPEKGYSRVAHRCLATCDVPEQSKMAIEACIKHGFAVEADFVWYKGNVKVYHDDTTSDKFGQPKSGAKKVNLENALTLQEFLQIVDGRVPIVFDLKDFRYHERRIEKEIFQALAEYDNGNGYQGEYVMQSFNPFAMKWVQKHHPEVIRGIVGHSLRGLRNKIPTRFVWAINFFLFYFSHPDFVIYDLDPYVEVLSRFNNIVGLPVIGYAPKCKEEIEGYESQFDGFIAECLADSEAWV